MENKKDEALKKVARNMGIKIPDKNKNQNGMNIYKEKEVKRKHKNKSILTEIPKPDFYTDLNIAELNIFSARNLTLETDKENRYTEVINSNDKKGIHKKLSITYFDKRLGSFDRKVLMAVQYLFCKAYNFDIIKNQFEIEYLHQLEQYRKQEKPEKWSIKLSQALLYKAMIIVQQKFPVYVKPKDIKEYLIKNNPKDITNYKSIDDSLERLSKTTINIESDYKVKKRKLAIRRVPLIENIKIEDLNLSVISLNPFEILNIVYKHCVGLNSKLLFSFDTDIGIRFYEYLNKNLFGANQKNAPYIKPYYSTICKFLRIKEHKKKSYMIQQFKKTLRDFIEKKLIVHWEFEKDLCGYYIKIHRDDAFYENYYRSLSPEERQAIENKILELERIDKKIILKLKKDIDIKFAYVKPGKENKLKNIKMYYLRYLIEKEYLK